MTQPDRPPVSGEPPTECGHFTVQSDHPDWKCLRCGERFLPVAGVHHIVAVEAGIQRADQLFGVQPEPPASPVRRSDRD